jgi:exosortase
MSQSTANLSDLQARDKVSPSLQWQFIGATVLLLVFAVPFHPFLFRQARWAVKNPADWGHTLVIPFIAGYFVYLRRQELQSTGLRTNWLGILPMLLGILMYFAATAGPQPLHHHNLHGFAAWLSFAGMVFLFTGFRALRYLWFPLVYLLIFGQTISEKLMEIVTFKLQDIAAVGSYWLMFILGLDVERAGNTLYLFSEGQQIPLNIAEACSGMRMLMAFMALSLFLAFTGLPRLWQRIALVIMAVPTALIVNILRVTTLGLLSLWDVDFAGGEFHSFVGLVWLMPALLMFLGIMWILRHLVVEQADTPGLSAEGAG